MKKLSDKLTEYVMQSGAIPEKSYAIYQYGFQIGLEMLSCILVSFAISVYLHMIPEFILVTGIFMLLRSYAGGMHLNSFIGCFFCSVLVQTMLLVIYNFYVFPRYVSWTILLLSGIQIWIMSPVECINHELEEGEKEHCRKVVFKMLVGIYIFAGFLTIGKMEEVISLMAMVFMVILFSQYVGEVKYKIEKENAETVNKSRSNVLKE